MAYYSAKFDEARYDSSKFNVQYESLSGNAYLEATSFDIVEYTIYIDQVKSFDSFIYQILPFNVFIDQVKEVEVEL